MSSDSNPQKTDAKVAVTEGTVSEVKADSGPAVAEPSPASDTKIEATGTKNASAEEDDEWMEPPMPPADTARGKSTNTTSGSSGGSKPRPVPKRNALGENDVEEDTQ